MTNEPNDASTSMPDDRPGDDTPAGGFSGGDEVVPLSDEETAESDPPDTRRGAMDQGRWGGPTYVPLVPVTPPARPETGITLHTTERTHRIG